MGKQLPNSGQETCFSNAAHLSFASSKVDLEGGVQKMPEGRGLGLDRTELASRVLLVPAMPFDKRFARSGWLKLLVRADFPRDERRRGGADVLTVGRCPLPVGEGVVTERGIGSFIPQEAPDRGDRFRRPLGIHYDTGSVRHHIALHLADRGRDGHQAELHCLNSGHRHSLEAAA